MQLRRFDYIQKWEEADLLVFANRAEDDEHEYKGSLLKDDALADKISIAASAFWNTGGGLLIVGIDKNGVIDGGISTQVGKNSRQDWVGQILNAKVTPQGRYMVQMIEAKDPTTSIKPNKAVLVIAFEDSPYDLHMAYDNRYYIRAGAHSVPASHFLVEALRTRRIFQEPILRALLKRSLRKSDVVELEILVVNNAVAFNVEVTFDPLPISLYENFRDRFPFTIPFVDQYHPFSMDLYVWGLRPEIFGDQPVELKVTFSNIFGQHQMYSQTIDVVKHIDPMTLGSTDLAEIQKAVT